MEIPLRNKNKEIIDYCIVSHEDYEHLNKFKWHLSQNKHVQGTIDNKNWFIHRYIYEILLNNKLKYGDIIDHIDRSPINNRRDNLRIVSFSENCRNRTKKKNASSKYIGVTYNKKSDIWQAIITINNNNLYAYYKNELHAAYQYNLWCKEYKLLSNLNDIEIPQDFVKYNKEEKILPNGVYKSRKNFCAKISIGGKMKYLGTYKTIEEAQQVFEKTKSDIIYPELPLLKNYNNECIIDIFNKNKEKLCETIIDKDTYYDLVKNKWSLDGGGYVQGKINGKMVSLSRYIMNYYGNDIIDHINNNKLDNRKSNLRIITRKQNAMNRTSRKNSTSKYLGVCFDKKSNKWISYITINKKTIKLGRFNDESEAAKVRNEATIKYFGEYGNLNDINDD